jgi:hypothetical protein
VLRRFEGFEMMGVEALFRRCGTRPVVYEAAVESKPYRWAWCVQGVIVYYIM